MASSVETAIRSLVTKGVMSIAEFNRDRLKEHGMSPYHRKTFKWDKPPKELTKR